MYPEIAAVVVVVDDIDDDDYEQLNFGKRT